jgi:hypothetical protein
LFAPIGTDGKNAHRSPSAASGWWSLKDKAKRFPAKQEQQNKQHQIATDDPVATSAQVAAVPVQTKQQPDDHKYPEQNPDWHCVFLCRFIK